jgi:hypothetical protein
LSPTLSVVSGPMYSRSTLLALLLILMSSDSLRSQSPECVDRSPAAFHKSQQIKINIVGVEFRGENSLSDVERSQLVADLQRSNFSVSPGGPDTYWANGLGMVANKALHAQGHVRAYTKVTAYLVKAEADQRSYAVSIEIETGPQYRIGTLQVVEATAFTPTELMKQIPLKPGDLFDEDKMAQGITSMKLLYVAKGYIDMSAGYSAPAHKIPGLIDVSVQVDEGLQYRVGTVEILGLNSKAENLLRSILVPGQVFDSHSFTEFLKENGGLLPVDASDDDITLERNLDDGTLQIVLDFRRCSGGKIPFPPVSRSAAFWGHPEFWGKDRWFHVSD